MRWRCRGDRASRAAAARFACGLVAALLVVAIAAPCRAESNAATSSRSAKQAAAESIPIKDLSREDAGRIAQVVNNATIYRRLPLQTIECDPNLFLFLTRNPDVIVGIWELMGISNVSLQRIDETTFRAGDNKGTNCTVELVHSTGGQQLYFAKGNYEGPFFQEPVTANCVLVLSSRYVKDNKGQTHVAGQADVFIEIDRTGLKLLAKTVQPLIGKAADYNFTETMTFVEHLSRASRENPAGVKRIAGKLTEIDPEVRERFVEVSAAVGEPVEAAPDETEPTVRKVKLATPPSAPASAPTRATPPRWRR